MQASLRRLRTPAERLEMALADSNRSIVEAAESEMNDVDHQVEQLARSIDAEKQRTIGAILAIGEHLEAVHELLAGTGRDGHFGPWLRSRCGFSRQSGHNYQTVYRRFGNLKCKSVLHFFDAAAIYKLASASTPDEAVKAAIVLAEQGEQVGIQTVKRLIGRTDEKPVDDAAPTGRCPNCASRRWSETEEGVSCSRCNQPYGEPTGGVDPARATTQIQKTVKVVEALMRAIDDTHLLMPRPAKHPEATDLLKRLWTIARGWM